MDTTSATRKPNSKHKESRSFGYMTDNRHEEMESLLRDLIAIKSISGNYQSSQQAIDYIANFVSERGMDVQTFNWDNHPSLIASTNPGNKKPRIMLQAHADVATAPDEMFMLTKKDGKFFGRGVYDMKAAIALYLQLIDDLKDSLHQYDLCLMVNTDEEYGDNSLNGVKHIVEDGYRPEIVVIPDNGTDWQIETMAKGVAFFKLEAHGRSAHGARPWEGENAIMKLQAALHQIVNSFGPSTPQGDTINVGVISGGEILNKVPHYAQAEIDTRLSSVESLQRHIKIVKQACEQHNVQWSLIREFEPVFFSLEEPHIRKFAQVIEKHTGIKNKGITSYAGSDARWFFREGVPVVGVRSPGGGLHSDVEWLDEAGFYIYYDILREYVKKAGRTTVDAKALTV